VKHHHGGVRAHNLRSWVGCIGRVCLWNLELSKLFFYVRGGTRCQKRPHKLSARSVDDSEKPILLRFFLGKDWLLVMDDGSCLALYVRLAICQRTPGEVLADPLSYSQQYE